MDYICFDTSIFVKENFLEGKRMKSFWKLFEDEKFQLIVSEIVVREVKNQFKKHANIAIEKHNTLLKEKVMHALRNVPESQSQITRLPKLVDLCNSFNHSFDEALKTARATILDYPTLDVTQVFDDYFSSRHPFGGGDKKSEFPDAIALHSLMQWCKDNSERCILFSKDKDLLGLTMPELKVIKDYEQFLDEYLIKERQKEALKNIIDENDKRINDDITYWVKSQLDDISLYYEHSNYLEVHDMSVEEVIIDEKSFTVVSNDDDETIIEMQIDLSFKVDLEIDDEEYGYYDDEDKNWIYMETKNISVMQQNDLSITIVFEKVDDELTGNFDIVEFNGGSKLKVKRPNYDY